MPGLLGSMALAVVLAAGPAGLPAPPAVASVSGLAAPATGTLQASTAVGLQAWPVLKEGSNSTWPRVTVRSLQYLLNAHGAKLTVDGVFGPKTKAAVAAFQRAHGLTGSGVVQASTWRSLLITVHRGSTGPAVRAVQDQINFRNLNNGHSLAVDGLFGPKTDTLVRAFQKAMAAEIAGFRADGIVGPQTWQALITEALSG